jgi:hypothetical protein
MSSDERVGAISWLIILVIVVGSIVTFSAIYKTREWTIKYEDVTRVFMNTPNSYVIYYRENGEIKTKYIEGEISLKILPSDQSMRAEQDIIESNFWAPDATTARIYLHDEKDVEGGSYRYGKGKIQKVNVVK